MIIYTVIKLDHAGSEVHRYQGRLLERDQNRIILEAFFDREDTPVGELVLKKGDRFVEAYYLNRWFNIFEIWDGGSDQPKGWYCNITSPAEFRQNEIAYRDLALDLLVYPDGRQTLLDEEEFEALPLSEIKRTQALQALAELITHFDNGKSLP